MSNLFDDNEFDSKFRTAHRMAVAAWVITLLATAAFGGVVVWAIIKTVNHFFG